MPEPVLFKEVTDFYVEVRTTMELNGWTEAFEQAFEEAKIRLRAGLAVDHDLGNLRMHTPLGPQAAAAFQAFKEWCAGWRA